MERIKYIVYQKEKAPSTGALHLQGYVMFTTPQRVPSAKRILGDDTIHLEKRMGTIQQAIDYCKKEDTRVEGPWEQGTPPKGQGHRSDLKQAVVDVRNGMSTSDMWENHPVEMVKFSKGLALAKAATYVPALRDVHTVVLHGETNTGKTFAVWSACGAKAYRLPDCKLANVQWWDGYVDQPILWIEEFNGSESRSIAELLVWLDRYPFMVRTSGGWVWAQWSLVVITCQMSPTEWYPAVLTQGHGPALQRRLTVVEQISNHGDSDVAIGIIKALMSQKNI